MRYCPTKNHIVGILTKVVKGEQFPKLNIHMGMMAFDSEVGTKFGSLAFKALVASEPSSFEGVRGGNYF